MIKRDELIEELNKLPKETMITFGLFDGAGGNVEFLDISLVDKKFIQSVRNSHVKDNPIVSYVITLCKINKI